MPSRLYIMGCHGEFPCFAAKRSKDPNTQVGACIVDSNNVDSIHRLQRILVGCSDDDLPWTELVRMFGTLTLFMPS